MGYQYALNQSMALNQRLVMNMAMRQALDVLQMPVDELSDWLEREIEQNPLLEITSPGLRDLSHLERATAETPHHYLSGEIRAHFDLCEEREIAEYIAGSLDEKGFLSLSIKEIGAALEVEEARVAEVLYRFQRMEPAGLGAEGVQGALLVQLEMKGLKGSVIYGVVEHYYSDLLRNRLKKITKVFRLSGQELRDLVHSKLRPLNPFPGHLFLHSHNPPITPDITIEKVGASWRVETSEGSLPTFQVHASYLEMVENKRLNREELDYFRRHIAVDRWLHRILSRRKETLEKITLYILKKQADFLEGETQTPLPMTMSEIAASLGKSESTITRAIANKYVASPLGLLKLRSFFTQALHTDEGAISNKRAKDLLRKLIDQEEKPLSDETLSQLLKEQGIPCARRTVAKYRKQLKILSSSERKLWK
ncbi:MAG: RNA polymerase sigma-54 factor [Chlamydiae bacterium]|nr:RNA polymerase sigma-54 factor [Chlamydiota bacterium]